jgi:hypothetical protein
MAHTPISSLAGVLAGWLSVNGINDARGAVTFSVILLVAGATFSAVRKVAHILTTLAAATAAVGGVALLLLILCGLIMAAWIMGMPL